jgi:hypothetical protein
MHPGNHLLMAEACWRVTGKLNTFAAPLRKYIIDAAQAGEIDADKLRDDALAFLANVSGRKEA